jgi:hypothetical protein
MRDPARPEQEESIAAGSRCNTRGSALRTTCQVNHLFARSGLVISTNPSTRGEKRIHETLRLVIPSLSVTGLIAGAPTLVMLVSEAIATLRKNLVSGENAEAYPPFTASRAREATLLNAQRRRRFCSVWLKQTQTGGAKRRDDRS